MDWLPDAGLCLVALACAWHAPHRAIAVPCALVICVDWFLYVLSWTDWSLHDGLVRLGIQIPGTQLWAPVDALTAAVIFTIGFDSLFAIALWGCLVAQLVGHILYQFEYLQFGSYRGYLDVLFWAQIACFILWGGRGLMSHAVNLVSHFANRFQLRARPRAQATRDAS